MTGRLSKGNYFERALLQQLLSSGRRWYTFWFLLTLVYAVMGSRARRACKFGFKYVPTGGCHSGEACLSIACIVYVVLAPTW